MFAKCQRWQKDKSFITRTGGGGVTQMLLNDDTHTHYVIHTQMTCAARDAELMMAQWINDGPLSATLARWPTPQIAPLNPCLARSVYIRSEFLDQW